MEILRVYLNLLSYVHVFCYFKCSRLCYFSLCKKDNVNVSNFDNVRVTTNDKVVLENKLKDIKVKNMGEVAADH